MSAVNRLLHYGVNSTLAQRAQVAGLTLMEIRSNSTNDIVEKFGLIIEEAGELKKCVTRQPTDQEVVRSLLDRSNHTCCICKGMKGGAIILHHIEEYESSQDNSYSNLAVLCPNDHDRAHRRGLSLGLSSDQIRRAKEAWEAQVELANAQAAARTIRVDDDAIDYVNVMRIEEMCVRQFGVVPPTTISPRLQRIGILGPGLRFDEAHVRKKLSSGRYLFDYISGSETEHYRQLLIKLSEVIAFEDLSEAARSGIRKLRALEGKYAYFIGAIYSKEPKLPIGRSSSPITFHHTTKRVRIIWDGGPNYLMSMSAISRQGRPNRCIIYGLVRAVHQEKPKDRIEVTAGPLLIAQPTVYIDRTPAIAWRGYWSLDTNADENLDSILGDDL